MTPPVIKFTKMCAGGNDFIVIDNLTAGEAETIEVDEDLIRRMCSRHASVGADGVIVIAASGAAHARMVYHNRDGGRAALCGNGVRCVARLLALKRVAPSDGMVIETDVGLLAAAVSQDQPWFRLPLGAPDMARMTLHVEGTLDQVSRSFEATRVAAGVPHLVVASRDAHGMPDFARVAAALRRHPDLGPEGANVDFITPRDRHMLDIRCYERGVEAETLTSGSGCIAAALAADAGGLAESPVSCRSRAGFVNTVTLERRGETVDAVLSGDARVIYTGVLHAEGLTGFEP
ncbi:MAG TPA: diaminopimelate epimerase [Candidatus Polarisedimenticolia bacterium]|nr:diaminopimelate epimerase [Candidatus Polarisedimenticolia bacterium]